MLSAVRNFAITFCASILIFGLLAYFVSGYAMKAMSGEEKTFTGEIETSHSDESDNKTETTGPAENPGAKIEGKSFNFLIIGTDYQPNILSYSYNESNLTEDGFPEPKRIASADTMILVRADKERGEFVFCGIPGKTKVMDEGLYKTLGSLYGEHDAAYLTEKVSFLVGMPIDYYAVFTIDGLTNIINNLGGVTYYVPANMKYTDESQQLYIDLRKGTQTLNGKQVLDMLRYNSYSDGKVTRIDTSVNFVNTMLARYLTPEVRMQASDYWNKYSQYMETNFTEGSLADNIDLIFSYGSFAQSIIAYPGSSTENGKFFEPNITKAWELFSPYKYSGNN